MARLLLRIHEANAIHCVVATVRGLDSESFIKTNIVAAVINLDFQVPHNLEGADSARNLFDVTDNRGCHLRFLPSNGPRFSPPAMLDVSQGTPTNELGGGHTGVV